MNKENSNREKSSIESSESNDLKSRTKEMDAAVPSSEEIFRESVKGNADGQRINLITDDEATFNAFKRRTAEERKALESQLNHIDVKPKNRKKIRIGKRLRALAILILLVAAVLFVRSGFFSVDTIKVEGNSYFTAEEIIAMGDAKTGGNIFWGIQKGKVKRRLLKNPYFESVSVSRELPRTVRITVAEKPQIAAFVYGEQFVVIDKEATVLRKSDVDPHVTLLIGLNISKIKEGETIEVEQDKTLATTLKMLSYMEKGDLYFKKIDMSEKIINAYIYDGLICKGTPKQLVESIKKGDLQKVVNNLVKNNNVVGTINLGNHDYISFSPN